MASINDVYKGAGDYLKAEDLKGKMIGLIIESSELKEYDRDGGGKDVKIVLSFVGKDKQLVVNKTNAATIAETHGDDYENWGGCSIKIFPTRVDFGGKMVDAIRVKMPEPEMAEPDEDGIGF